MSVNFDSQQLTFSFTWDILAHSKIVENKFIFVTRVFEMKATICKQKRTLRKIHVKAKYTPGHM